MVGRWWGYFHVKWWFRVHEAALQEKMRAVCCHPQAPLPRGRCPVSQGHSALPLCLAVNSDRACRVGPSLSAALGEQPAAPWDWRQKPEAGHQLLPLRGSSEWAGCGDRPCSAGSRGQRGHEQLPLPCWRQPSSCLLQNLHMPPRLPHPAAEVQLPTPSGAARPLGLSSSAASPSRAGQGC